MSQNSVPVTNSTKTTVNDSGARAANNSASMRLKRELKNVMKAQMDKNVTVSAFPSEGNILKWVATISGASETAYEGLTYKLSMEFPPSYPISPPVVKFTSHIFHPNVDQSGNICLDILKEKWVASYDIIAVLLSIQSLLGEPNNNSPLNAVAAKLWPKTEEYKKEVVSQYNMHNDVAPKK